MEKGTLTMTDAASNTDQTGQGEELAPDVMAFLQKIHDAANDWPQHEQLALRKLITAGMLADEQVVQALSDDTTGYGGYYHTPSQHINTYPSHYQTTYHAPTYIPVYYAPPPHTTLTYTPVYHSGYPWYYQPQHGYGHHA